MRIVGLIPARGGSKGIPRKNVRVLAGKPLLQYTIEAAQLARSLDRLLVSTDDEEIAAQARLCGAEAPFLRPSVLALDDTPTLPVVKHALLWLEGHGETFDAVCLLQPTHPLRTPEIIDGCCQLLQKENLHSVVTVLPVPCEYNPHWVFLKDDCGHLHLATGENTIIPRRQELPAAFHREGSVYVTRRDVVIRESSLYGERIGGFQVDPEWSVNIDGPKDWDRAERLLRARTNEPVGGRRCAG